ncbi:MAG: membrane integrity-associated transporter subunit PqiC [Magnetovibrio sp.]|nr:membrane integrity-associated transporter subunit PqiC [Magnetovibrio sp.]
MKRTSKYVLKTVSSGVLALGLLSACGTPSPVPEDAFYRISPSVDTVGQQALEGIVEVGRFAASGSLGNRPLLMSSRDSNAVSEYHYHFWIEAPPILLQSALVSALRASKVAKTVVTPEMRVTPEFTVTGRVLRLETIRGQSPAGLVSLELSLRREKDGKLLVLQEYTAEVDADRDNVVAAAAALEKAVSQVFSNFIYDIRKVSM